jgi:hypothetical protein
LKAAGFTIIRNAIQYDYPVVESIQSVLPWVDKFYVGVGKSDDDTLGLIRSIGSDKIEIIETVWDMQLRVGGKLLSVETNKVFDVIPLTYDWCFYIQADEVFHEEDGPKLREYMQRYSGNTTVEGMLFDYVHFYGTYDYIGDSRRWYRKEIRVIRNNKTIRSYKDAQGFRKSNDEKLNVIETGCRIHHYGWVKHPAKQKEKEKNFHKMWHDDKWMQENVKADDEFDYSGIDSLSLFKGKHPQVMQKRIEEKNWNFNYDPNKRKLKAKDKVLLWIEQLTGKRLFEYKNYKLIKPNK